MRAIVLAAAMGVIALPALAQSDDASTVERVGDWTVFRTELGCGIEKTELNGRQPSTLTVYRFADGRLAAEIKNRGWSIQSGQNRRIYTVFDNVGFETDAVAPSDGKVLFPIGKNMAGAFAASNFVTFFLKVDEDREIPLEQFALTKSASALASADRCNAVVKADKASTDAEAARLKRRSEKVPSDPFSVIQRAP